jgi:hypothetical protein
MKKTLLKISIVLMLRVSTVMAADEPLSQEAKLKEGSISEVTAYEGVVYFDVDFQCPGGDFIRSRVTGLINSEPDAPLRKLIQQSIKSQFYIVEGTAITLRSIKREDGKITDARASDIAAVWKKVNELDPTYEGKRDDFSELPLRLAKFLGGVPDSKEGTLKKNSTHYILCAHIGKRPLEFHRLTSEGRSLVAFDAEHLAQATLGELLDAQSAAVQMCKPTVGNSSSLVVSVESRPLERLKPTGADVND